MTLSLATAFMAGVLVGIAGTVYTLAAKGLTVQDQNDIRTEAYMRGFFAGIRLGLLKLVRKA